MFKTTIYSILLTMLFTSIGVAQSEQDADQKSMFGKWKVVKATMDGKDAPEEVLKIRMIFTEEKMSLQGPKDVEFSYEIKSNSNPKGFRMTALSGNHKDELGIGFYKFEKEQLHLWLPNSPNSKDPPKTLEDEQAKDLAHFVMEKITEEEKKEGEKK